MEKLHEYKILDTFPEAVFDDIVVLASQICETPIALISFVDSDRQWFKAKVGINAEQTPRSVAFCSHAIESGELLEVKNAKADSRFANNPLVTGPQAIHFYAGSPIKTDEGLCLGTVCVIDSKPRSLSDAQKDSLTRLSNQVLRLLELRYESSLSLNAQRNSNIYSSMLAKLNELNLTSFNSTEQLLSAHLKAGCEILNLETGIVSEIKEGVYRIRSVSSPYETFKSGDTFDVNQTYCQKVVETQKTFSSVHIGQDKELKGHPCYQNSGLETYIGTPIWLGPQFYGTLNITSKSIRLTPFSKNEIDFVEILARAISHKVQVERELMEQRTLISALRETRKNLEAVIDSSPNGIAILNESGTITMCNKTFEHIFASERASNEPDEPLEDDLQGRGFGSLITSYLPSFDEIELDGELTNKVRKMNNISGVDRAGNMVPVSLTISKMIAQGSPATMLTVEDLSHVKSVEDRFWSVFRNAGFGMALVGPNGEIKEFNQSLLAFLGYTSVELKNQNFHDLLNPIYQEAQAHALKSLTSGKLRVYEAEVQFTTKLGKKSWGRSCISLMRKRDGTPSLFIWQIEDITARRQAQEELTQKSIELQRSNEELQQFAYVASHDLQAPLRHVSSYVGLVTKKLDIESDDQLKKWVGFILDGTSKMKQLISDLLLYSRVNGGSVPFEKVDLDEIIRQTVEIINTSREGQKINFHLSHLPTIVCRKTHIVQVFQNLIDNAIKFISPGVPPEITISFVENPTHWQFIVSDNGIGIDSEQRKRIFQVFQRLHGEDKYPGTGIGLSICKKAVELHGGTIWCENNQPNGTTFCFTIDKTLKEN